MRLLRPCPSRSRRLWLAQALVCALCLLTAAPVASQPTLTFVEGEATLVSGGRTFVPAAGVRLRHCDALRTGRTAMLQVEFADGTAVLLGPDTRFVFDVPALAAAPKRMQFLHSGWAKVTAPAQRANVTPYLIETPSFDLLIESGTAVLRMAANITQVYVELGAAMALETAAPPPGRVVVRSGFTYSRKAGEPAGALSTGAEPDLARSLPRTLRETLPMRLALVKDRDVRPRAAAGQADAEEWLAAAPELRPCAAGESEALREGIRKAQEILARRGFDVGPVDGVLGVRTAAALRSFQQQAGLPPSGELDAETRRALDEAASR